jgi:hypothetical protein
MLRSKIFLIQYHNINDKLHFDMYLSLLNNVKQGIITNVMIYKNL